MKARCSGYSSDSEQQKQKDDLSVLRAPIHTALAGFMEAKNAYENGTDEIRRLLSRECDIIYECNVCRNMFRSLANFISHKRVYCRKLHNNFNLHNNTNGFIDQDISTIIQAEQEFINQKQPELKENPLNKDLSSIIERLVTREESNRRMKLSDFYDQINNKLTQEQVLKQNHTLQLDAVPNSSVAVYQTVKSNENDNDNIKVEVKEVHELLNNDSNVLGPDGKILPKQEGGAANGEVDTAAINPKNEEEDEVEQISCDVCNQKFSTEKTLKLHIQAKHIAATYVYQCPSCSLTFFQPSAVIRHLSNDHKKSLRRIRMLRETIYNKRMRADQVQVKPPSGPSRELARLQTTLEKDKREADNKAWSDNIDRANNAPMCTYCGKSFERKAVLTTHLNNCPMKNKASALVTAKVEDSPVKLQPPKVLEESSNDSANASALDINGDSRDSLDSSKGSRRKRRKPPKVVIKNEDPDSDTLNEMFLNLGKETDKMTLNTLSLDNIANEESNEPVLDTTPMEIKIEPKDEIKSESTEPKRMQKPQPCLCKICEKRFDALGNLRRHISMFHYRSRRYGCNMCEYRAYRKYDVANHLGTAHAVTGDRDAVMEMVETHMEKYFKEDVDEDIVVITDEDAMEMSARALEKRQRRSRQAQSQSAAVAPEAKSTRSSLNSSNTSVESPKYTSFDSDLPSPVAPKRPTRNRIKPINKDFVYDLSNLLKKDMAQAGATAEKEMVLRASKRRSTVSIERPERIIAKPFESVQAKLPVQGAAQRMCQTAVGDNKATLGSLPNIPTERPVIRSRLLSSYRSDETYPTAVKIEPTSFSDSSFLDQFSKRRKLDLTMTRKRSSGESTITSLLQKVDINMNGTDKQTLQKRICKDDAPMQSFVDPPPSIPRESSPPPAPTKRVSILQRITDNKSKKEKVQESLLRSALEDN